MISVEIKQIISFFFNNKNEIILIYVNSYNKEEIIALLINKIKLFSEIF